MRSQRIGVRGQGLWLGTAVALALAPLTAGAVGLGAIEVKSRLDQPFLAEIPLTLNDPSEANSLVVHLASPEAFARVGLDRSVQVGANLTFTLTRNARGDQVIRVTTPQKLNDPYVSFLLEADWGSGKMVREYTALLDPPRMASVPHRAISAPQVASTPMPAVAQPVAPTAPPSIAAAPAPTPSHVAAPAPQPVEQFPSINAAAAPMQPAPAPVAPAQPTASPVAATAQPAPPPSAYSAPTETASSPQPVTAPPPAPVAVAPEPTPAAQVEPAAPPPPPEPAPIAANPEPAAESAPASASATPASVTVADGDTLSRIALANKPADVSLNRMMIALQRTNPDAFIHSNINLLKSGAVLRIPSGDDTQALTAAEADSLVSEQVESWREGNQAAPSLQPEGGAESAVARSAKPAQTAAPTDESTKPTEKNATTAESAAASPPVTSVRQRKPRGARLEIVPPAGNAAANSQSGASEGGSGSELRAQLTQTKEELAARNSEVSDLKSRVADLEKIQKDSQQLITMKDSQLAAMQQKLAELEKQKNAAAPVAAASSAAAVASAPAPAASAAAATTTKPAQPSPLSAPAAKHSIAPPSSPADNTPWFLETWFLVGVGSLVLAGLLFLMLRKPKPTVPATRPRGMGNGALAASLAAANASASPAKPEPRLEPAPPAPSVTGRSTITDPLQPVFKPSAPPPAPPPPKAALSPAPTPVPPPPAAAKDDWAMDAKSAPLPASQVITKEHPVVPELDDPNQTVATKLELARAYIDIGDHDGARGMLEEVLIEGNGPQQEEAFKLLDTLDG